MKNPLVASLVPKVIAKRQMIMEMARVASPDNYWVRVRNATRNPQSRRHTSLNRSSSDLTTWCGVPS